jgi:hypothetical protein
MGDTPFTESFGGAGARARGTRPFNSTDNFPPDFHLVRTNCSDCRNAALEYLMSSPMTAVEDRGAPSSEAENAPRTCDVCPHETGSHDPISRRYCAATLATALTRGCICT